MRRRIRLTTHHVYRPKKALLALAATTALLQAAAAVGLSYVAGFSHVARVLVAVRWYWLVVMTAALLVSFAGYHLACRGVYEVQGGPRLPAAQMRSVSIAGFGGFLAEGGSGLDKFALNAAGADDRQASVRVGALAALEHGVLGFIGMAGGIAALVRGYRVPSLGFSLPWAVIPLPAFALGFWLADRLGPRIVGSTRGWQRHVALLVECIFMVRHLFATAFRRPYAAWGMALFWAAEMLSVWAGLAAFGLHLSASRLVIAVGTGMVFTRRTGPLGGAGVILLTLAASLYYCGVPLAVAVAGVTAYRVVSLWLPMPFSVAQLPTLRGLVHRRSAPAETSMCGPPPSGLPDRQAS